MTKTTIRYSVCFKLQVLEEIEERGLIISSFRRKYDISGGSTIQKWIKEYSKQDCTSKQWN